MFALSARYVSATHEIDAQDFSFQMEAGGLSAVLTLKHILVWFAFMRVVHTRTAWQP